MKIFQTLLGAVLRLWRWAFYRQTLYRACHVEEAPDTLEKWTVYIVGADGYDWSAVMACPGGCGKALEMNLLPTATPVWAVREDNTGIVSLDPSVWLKTGCKCHFFLKNGVIDWV